MNQPISGIGKTIICIVYWQKKKNLVIRTTAIGFEAGHMFTLEKMFQKHLAYCLLLATLGKILKIEMNLFAGKKKQK